MDSGEIRQKFLQYFEQQCHKILPGSSLVPKDPTVLLTLAGMLQFKPVFLGQEKPKYQRVATAQKCLRMLDIERVGKTARHHTFFEMLGNFSFGDYFKLEAIKFAWELLVKEFKLPLDKLNVAVFKDDDEAYAIWQKELGLPKNKIFRLGADNNFWAVGPTGPCGPCSEIYYDFGPAKGCGKPACSPGCDCDRFLEVWNLVFIQYNRDEKGQLIPLKNKGIDTGMGLERIASILQGVDSNFETDLFVPLIDKVKALCGKTPPGQLALRIIADHCRAATHLVSDGVLPDNVGRGYVLRRLIRRAVRYGKLAGLNQPFLFELADVVIKQMGEAYPGLKEKSQIIKQVLKTEEQNFFATLDRGLNLFNELLDKYKDKKVIPGPSVFKLHDTFGFPVELTREMALDCGFTLDEPGFAQAMQAQKELGRSAGLGQKEADLIGLPLEKFEATKFTGYDKIDGKTKVEAVFLDKNLLVLEQSPFYGESGGQVGDTGLIRKGPDEIRVLDTLITPQGVILHKIDRLDDMKEKDKVEVLIDNSRRQAISIHHTATHLLHQALREVLGSQVKQAGSYVGPDKLRFDFSNFSALTAEQIAQVEDIVNKKIKEDLKVEVLNKSYLDAVKMGAMALFGEKYGDKVRALKIADYSLELCGGTHVKSTGELLFFKISSEGALGAGLRRIEAQAGQVAKIALVFKIKHLEREVESLINKYTELQQEKDSLGGIKFVDTNIFEIETAEIRSLSLAIDRQDSVSVRKFLDHLLGRLDWIKERIQKITAGIKDLKLKNSSLEAGNYLAEIRPINGINVLVKELKDYDMQMMRQVSDVIQNQAKSCVIVLASLVSGRALVLISVTPDLVAKGYKANSLANEFFATAGGKGGGKEEKFEGGGSDPAKITQGFSKIIGIISGG